MSGSLQPTQLNPSEQFSVVNDEKLRMSLISLADRYDEQIRDLIYKTYNDIKLMLVYQRIRTSGVYQHGSKDKVRRKILEFPHPHVYDFVNTVLTQLYGKDWLSQDKALKHELVRPWWVVEKL